MDNNFLCPICHKDNCFVCRYWNDDNLTDLLLAENGAFCYDRFDSIWYELLTHYFVYNGKLSTSLNELLNVFQKKEVKALGLISFLNSLKDQKQIRIEELEQKKSWFASILSIFKTKAIPETSIVRCDYLSKEAMEQFLDLADRHNAIYFVLRSKPSTLEFIRSNQGMLDEVGVNYYRIKEAAQEWIPYQPCRPLDIRAQAKLLLRNLQEGEDLEFATYCMNHGAGTIISYQHFSVFSLNTDHAMDLQISRIVVMAELNQIEKERSVMAEEVRLKIQQAKKKKNCKEECTRLKSLYEKKYDSLAKKKTALKKNLDVIQEALDVHTLYNTQMETAAVVRKNLVSLRDAEEVAESVENQQAEVKELMERVMETGEEELEKELDASIQKELPYANPNQSPIVESIDRIAEME